MFFPKNYRLFVFSFCLFSCFSIKSGFFAKNFTQSGTFSGEVVSAEGETMVNNGKTIATEAIKLRYEKSFSGSGYVQAPQIEIITRKFEFTGTIKCDVKCVITVQEPFDQSIFTKTGAGAFIVNVDPNLFTQKVEPVVLPVFVETKKANSEVSAAAVEPNWSKSEPEKGIKENENKEDKIINARFFEKHREILVKCVSFGIMAAIISASFYLAWYLDKKCGIRFELA